MFVRTFNNNECYRKFIFVIEVAGGGAGGVAGGGAGGDFILCIKKQGGRRGIIFLQTECGDGAEPGGIAA